MKTVAYRFAFLHRALMLIGIMLCTLTVHATTFIKDVKVIGGTKDETKELKETLTKQGWTFIDYDLNKGASGDYIYLLYKADENTDGVNWGYITNFYISNEGDVADDSHTVDGRTYYLTDYAGGEHFKEKKGDLNSGTGHGSANIHLYYTKDLSTDYRAITGITFNDTQDGAVGLKGGTTGYDLNEDCGSGTDYIYMHITTATVTPGPMTVTIGNETYAFYNIPFKMDKNYSLTEQIYTAEEIGMAGTITSIAFQYASSGAFSMSGVQVYLKHTDKNDFGDYSMVPLSAEDKVFEGTFSATGAGWVTITFDTPFEYDGNSNLLVCCYDPTDGNLGTGYLFYKHAPGSIKVIQGYSDNLVPSLDGANWISNWGVSTETSKNSRNNIRFNIIPNTFFKPENLCVSSCTEETATLTWAAPATGNTITGYGYQFKKTSDSSWPAEVTTTATTATFSNLAADTDYDFRVRTLYGSYKSSYKILHFTTATSLPYEQGFENGLGRWGMVDVDWGNTGIDADAKHNGENGFQFKWFLSGEHGPQYLISPRFSGNEGLTVSFYHNTRSINGAKFKIGYSTTSSDPAAFTWADEITPAYLVWNRAEYIFPEGTCYVAISFDYVDDKYAHSLFLDDFTFDEYSPYAKPVNVAVSNLTDSKATLSWTAPDGSPTGYTYQYKKENEATWSAATNVSGTSVTLSSLITNTTYDFRVKARYSGGKASNYVTFRFMTEAAMVSLPFTDGFENGMGGWRIVDGRPRTDICADNVRKGTSAFMFQGQADEPQYLMSPWLNGSTDMNVSFWYKNYIEGNTSYLAGFQVGYSTTSRDTTAFTWSELIKSSHEWQQYSANLPAGTRFVAVKLIGGYWLYLDDFSFNEPPTTLSSADDWDLLARFVEGGWTAEGVTIKMTDDFTATKTIGNAEHPFCGTFDGQGHTLTLNISSSGRVAPFLEINGATIKNLKVTGDMIAGGVAYSGGLVGCVAGGTNLIQNCVVDALISMSDPEGGGIVGYVNNADITIEGCVFTGFLYNNGLSLGGAMYATTLIGYADGNPSVILLKNCLDASNMTGPLGRGAADPITNCYYTRDEKSSYSNQGGWISPARQAISTDTPPANIGQPGTDYGFVQAYSNGLKYNGKYYMALSDFEDNPTDVPFIPYPAKAEDKQEGSWYTIDGRLLEQAPTAPGLYIHNSETILLK